MREPITTKRGQRTKKNNAQRTSATHDAQHRTRTLFVFLCMGTAVLLFRFPDGLWAISMAATMVHLWGLHGASVVVNSCFVARTSMVFPLWFSGAFIVRW